MRTLSVKLAATALALATLTVVVAGPAGASTVGGAGTVGGPSGSTANAGSRYNTGSANLDKLASSLTFHNKSVTAVLRAPAGLRLTRPVDIVVLFGLRQVSQSYSNANGNRLAHDFDPGTGALRRERVTIVLNERDPLTNQTVKSFAINTGADVLALWDVIVNPLHITFWEQCDWHSDADPHVRWSDATGTDHDTNLDPDFGETITIDQGFSGIWHEVKAADPLFQPAMAWYEDDGLGFHPVGLPTEDDPLLPTPDQDNSIILEDTGGSCSAVFSYSVRVILRTYPGLPTV
jgi:hypothetical protein